MKTNTNISAMRDALAYELMSTCGPRVVSAWLATSQQDEAYDKGERQVLDYALDNEEAPYLLRDAVGTEIGWGPASEGLDPDSDISRYSEYLRLHDIFGFYWAENALREHLQEKYGLSSLEASPTASKIWEVAVKQHAELSELMRREEELAELAA